MHNNRRDNRHEIEADIVIIGGGMAGLSLAARLADARFAHWRIVVIEPRTEYHRDRTWCYWRVGTHPFEAAVASKWPRWQVNCVDAKAGLINAVCEPECNANCQANWHYEMIPADRFYALALEKISQAKHIELQLGVNVISVQSHDDDATMPAEIKTSDGNIRTALVFDSRPPTKLSKAAWIQGFHGIEVETEEAVFDEKMVTLMDFSFQQGVHEGGSRPASEVHFMYVLPLSPKRALVENTTFTEMHGFSNTPVDETVIQRYLAEKFGVKNIRILHREQGAIPLDASLRPSRTRRKCIKIGAGGGMARASSGYAFFETQRACDAIAEKLALSPSLQNGFKLPVWRSRFSYWMDAVFLRVLAQQPGIAPKLFTNLFLQVPADVLVRFLSGVATPMDTLRVIAACPKRPFLRAAFL